MSVGVLVMAHGTPAAPEEIGPFYTAIRGGRPPTAEQLDDLMARYRAIGGLSPLRARTRAQVEGLTAELEGRAPGRYRVAWGAKHTEPSIEEAARALAASDPRAVVGLVLTPQRSSRGSEEYLERAARALEERDRPVPFAPVHEWFDAPGLAGLWAARVRRALALLPPGSTVVFSAHSVPETPGAATATYCRQVGETAALVAGAAGLDEAGVPWSVAWQSAGRTAQRWLGPDLLSTIERLGASGAPGVVVCPVGFVADHLEILYDLDVEAAARAKAAGLAFARTESLNDDPAFLAVLAGVVERAAGAVAP